MGDYMLRIGDRLAEIELPLEDAEELARRGSADTPVLYFVVDQEGHVRSEWSNGVCTWRHH